MRGYILTEHESTADGATTSREVGRFPEESDARFTAEVFGAVMEAFAGGSTYRYEVRVATWNLVEGSGGGRKYWG